MNQIYLERNISFVKKHLSAHAKDGFDIIIKTLTNEMNGIGILLRPAIWMAYDFVIKPSLINTVKHAILHIVRIAKIVLLDEIQLESNHYNELLDREYPIYLENDVTAKFCRKSHHNYPLLLENLRHIFDWQIRSIYYLIQSSDEHLTNYPELYKATWSQVDGCINVLKSQLDLVTKSMDILGIDANILDMPIASEFIVRVLHKAYDEKIVQMYQEVRDIYRGILPFYLKK